MTDYVLNIVNLLNDTNSIFTSSLCQVSEWLLATLGLTFAVNYTKLLRKLREKFAFLKCSQCVGFWAGIFLLLFSNPILNAGLSASFICFMAYLVTAELIKKHG